MFVKQQNMSFSVTFFLPVNKESQIIHFFYGYDCSCTLHNLEAPVSVYCIFSRMSLFLFDQFCSQNTMNIAITRM